MGRPKRVFTVDGKPFFSLGCQSRNSSGYTQAEAETAFQAVKMLHGNTLAIPVYWEQVEPEEGRFDFSAVDGLLASARRHGVHLTLPWFASWKNGTMDYVPGWVKTNPERFHRVTSSTGVDLWVLSSHCLANVEADRRAFVALCRHLAEQDSAEQTVIAIQIENEPGIVGSDRDYGPEAEAEYAAQVPEDLMAALRRAGQGPLHALWTQAGCRESGTWPEVFGWAAGEVVTGYSIARYIDSIAEAGKAVHDIPMYVNAWLKEQAWQIPGESYPSGGAQTPTLDIYRWCAPHLDFVAPDIYIADSRGYEAICATYARPDNPLYIPESGPGGSNVRNLFRAIAGYDAIGYHFFSAEYVVAPDGSLRSELQQLADSFRCVASAIPLLLQHQGTGRVHAVIQEEDQEAQYLDLDGYVGLVQFGDGPGPRVRKDWRHLSQRMLPAESTAAVRGRGLVFQAGQHEFYIVGANCRLFLRPKRSPQHMRSSSFIADFMLNRTAHYLTVDEGHFDDAGNFVVDRRRNGDELNYGAWVEPDTGVVRVVMCE